jgi:hypothetical protein
MNAVEQLAHAFSVTAEALSEAHKHPHGPVYKPEDQKAAGEACVKLCGGNHDQARTLWKLIVEDLGGYMPAAAVTALIRAANTTNLVPDIEAPEVS